MWLMVAQLVVALVVSYALMPSAQGQSKGPENFDQIDFPQAEEGTPQMVVFGDCWCSDWTILAIGNYRTKAIERDAGGGK